MSAEVQAEASLARVSELRTSVPAPPAPHTTWHLSSRILFRFAFSYLLLYCFPFPLGTIPYTDWPAEKYQDMWKLLVPWVGRHVLHLGRDITVFTNGSGDTTYDWVLTLCYIVMAIMATAVWSALDRKQLSYESLLKWTRLYVRFVLAAAMISYGAYKVIPSQFPQPALSRLVESYGDSSPMGLLWTFMGASPAYTRFAGAAELLAGILLVIPGLTALGSLVTVAVMTNVFLLNMCYDTPVKLYSFHLLSMAGFLLVPDLRRLANLFVFHRTARLSKDAALFQRRRLNQAAVVVQLLFGVLLLGISLYESWQQFNEVGAKPSHYGMWSVDEFSVDGQMRPPLITDASRWRRVFFEYENFWAMQPMEGPRRNFRLKLDSAKKALTLSRYDDPKWNSVLVFDDSQPNAMILTGQFDGHQVVARLRKVDDSAFLLRSRGFHWINEFPFNR